MLLWRTYQFDRYYLVTLFRPNVLRCSYVALCLTWSNIWSFLNLFAMCVCVIFLCGQNCDLSANSNLLKNNILNCFCAYEMNRDLVLIYLSPLRRSTHKHKLFCARWWCARQEATIHFVFLLWNFIWAYLCVYRLRAINSNKMQYKLKSRPNKYGSHQDFMRMVWVLMLYTATTI